MRFFHWAMILFISFCSALSFTPTSHAGNLSLVESGRWVKVEKIIDGATFQIDTGDKVRLLGINTPAISLISHEGEPMGKQAYELLLELIEGQVVRLTSDAEKEDSDGHLLAHVYLRNGTWVNAELVKKGLAYVRTFPPNISKANDLITIEKQARKQTLGIWATNRFKVIDVEAGDKATIGDFRLVKGIADNLSDDGFAFSIGKLRVSVPAAYRQYFLHFELPVNQGQMVIVRGVMETNSDGDVSLEIYSSADVEVLE